MPLTSQTPPPPIRPQRAVASTMLSLDIDPSLAFNQHDSVSIDKTSNTTVQPPQAQFKATWSPSKTAALNPSNFPMSKQPRAWDRKACAPAAEQSRVKTVWKRYELRPPAQRLQSLTQITNMEGGNGAPAQAEKVVKRARVDEPRDGKKVTYKATRWERRRSRGVTSEFGFDSHSDACPLTTVFQENYQSSHQK